MNNKYNNIDTSIRKLTLDYVNKHHCIWGESNDIRHEIIKRNNDLIYRNNATIWNYYQLHAQVQKTKALISASTNRNEIVPTIMNSLFPTSYNFDDVIFNLISMFDYLASLLGLVIINNPNQRHKWNQLVNILRNNETHFPNTTNRIITAHNRWVDKLASYRGGLYHQTTDIGSAEHFFDFSTGEDIVTFYLPGKAVRHLPCFKKRKDIELLSGVEELIDNSIDLQNQLLDVCYEEKSGGRETQ